MRYKTTFLLVVVTLVTGAFIWIVEKKTAPEDGMPATETRVLNIEPERVNFASFYRDGELIECVNERGQWFISKPVRDRADSSAVHQILATVKMLPVLEIVTAPEREARGLALDDFGLAEPRAWFSTGTGEARRKLLIGGKSPLGDSVFVRLENEENIIVTSADLLDSMPVRADDIRDKALFRGFLSDVNRLEIKRRDRPMVELVLEGLEWVIHKPGIARADWLKVTSLLDNLFSIRIQRFVTETMTDPIAYGLEEDDAVLTIRLRRRQDQDEETVFFGKTAEGQEEMLYANRKGSASVYAVNRIHVESIGGTAADLRDSRLYFMASDRIGFISMKDGDNELELHRTDSAAWKIARPQQWAADGRVVADLVNRLNSLRITAFVDNSDTQDFGLDMPARVIMVAESAPDTEQINAARRGRALKLGRVQSGQESVFARFDDDPQIYQLSAASVMTLSLDPLTYRDRTVLALEPSTIRSITLRKNGVEESVERDSTGQWIPSHSGRELDQEVVENVLTEISALSVSRFECSGKRNLKVYGLQDAPVSLTFSLTGEGGIRKTLLLGSESDALGVYAMVQGMDLVFVLEQEKVELLVRSLTR